VSRFFVYALHRVELGDVRSSRTVVEARSVAAKVPVNVIGIPPTIPVAATR
jgi:hypothetical protein